MAKYELMVKNETIATLRIDFEDEDDRMNDDVLWMRFRGQFPLTAEAIDGIEDVRLVGAMGDMKPMEDFEMSRMVLEFEGDRMEDEAQKTECVIVGDVEYDLNCDGTITAVYDNGDTQVINGGNNREMWKMIVFDGADPVADGWEDGAGNPVCKDWNSVDEASRIVTIRADGRSSYKVTITDLVRELGLDIGDQVKVTVKKL